MGAVAPIVGRAIAAKPATMQNRPAYLCLYFNLKIGDFMEHTVQGLLWFDDLTSTLKDKARVQIIFIEKAANKTRRQLLKLKPLHQRINDKHHIRRELNGIKALAKINKEGILYLDKHIRLNFCEFDAKGQYCTFKKSGYKPYNLSF